MWYLFVGPNEILCRAPVSRNKLTHLLIQPIGEDGSRSQVFAAHYHEPETGIRHAVAVKKFPPARTQQELKSVHREVLTCTSTFSPTGSLSLCESQNPYPEARGGGARL